MLAVSGIGASVSVDDMCSDEIRAAFERLGLADLLYQNRPQVA